MKIALFGISEIKLGRHNLKDPRLDETHKLVEADKKAQAQVEIVGEEELLTADAILASTLKKVSGFFYPHPAVDIVFGDCVVVDARGNYLCERRPLKPRRFHIWTSGNLGFLTAATFLRRRVVDQHQLFFNDNLRYIGDAEWTLRVIKAGLPTAVVSEFLSVFTETGSNLNLGAKTAGERRQFMASAPLIAQLLAPLWVAHFRLRRWCAGHYRCRPHDYSIYTLDSPDQRRTFHVNNPTFRWTRPRPEAK